MPQDTTLNPFQPIDRENPKPWDRLEPYEGFWAEAEKARILMQGTSGIRLKGTKYLPAFPRESSADYRNRLSQSTLLNKFSSTIAQTVGRMTRRPAEVKPNPPWFREWARDVNLADDDLPTLIKSVSQEALLLGITFLIVDRPPAGPDDTAADDRAVQPWIEMVHAESVNWFRKEVVGGSYQLAEFIVQDDNEHIRQYIMQDGVPTLNQWEKRKEADNRLTYGWQIVSAATFALDQLPIVPVYAHKVGYCMGGPVYRDLADLNLKHYNLSSAHDHASIYTSIPQWVGKGMATKRGDRRQQLSEPPTAYADVPVDATGERLPGYLGVDQPWNPLGNSDPSSPNVAIAPNRIWTSPENASIELIESSGRTQQNNMEYLKQVEALMDGAAGILDSGNPYRTATGEISAHWKETSPLQSIQRSIQKALNRALAFVAIYKGQVWSPDRLQLNQDVALLDSTQPVVESFFRLAEKNQLTLRTALLQAIRRGALPEEFDVDAELAALEEERAAREAAAPPIEEVEETVEEEDDE